MKIAVVGSGAAGLSAFWALNEHSEHEVYLYEKEGRLGGHANAITVQVPGKEPCSVDTAFIMLNKEGYPTFWSFLDRLKIPLVKTDTSFSVSQGAQAWGSSFNGLFATPGSALKPRLWRMMFDLFRFHYACLDLLKPEVDESVSVGEYLDTNKYGDGFREDYLLPLAATFWSLPPERVVRECPIKTLVRNFHNHSLLQLWSRFTWYTIAGGSRSYIDRIVQNVPSERIRLSTPIQSMTKTDHGIEVIEGDGATNTFDHVIMATHADTTLRILQRGNLLTARDEKSLLDACDWSQFEIVMHHDESAMPANQGVWSAWNTLLPDTDRGVLSPNPQDDSVSCTFDMNLLHAVPAGKHGRIFGTLNPPEPIDPSKVFGRFSYSTPIFTTRLIDTQRRLDATAHTRFASGLSLVGAWMGLGTHEDAWEGGIAAARSLGADVCLTKRGKDRDVLESKVDWVIKWVLIVMGMLIAELEVLLVVVGEKLEIVFPNVVTFDTATSTRHQLIATTPAARRDWIAVGSLGNLHRTTSGGIRLAVQRGKTTSSPARSANHIPTPCQLCLRRTVLPQEQQRRHIATSSATAPLGDGLKASDRVRANRNEIGRKSIHTSASASAHIASDVEQNNWHPPPPPPASSRSTAAPDPWVDSGASRRKPSEKVIDEASHQAVSWNDVLGSSAAGPSTHSTAKATAQATVQAEADSMLPEITDADFTSTAVHVDLPAYPDSGKVTKKRNRRSKRRHVIPDMQPLPVGELPPDGLSRFDWRQTSLNVQPKPAGRRWYPATDRKRVAAEMTKLTWGDDYHDELLRYQDHFIPMLEAEFAEEEHYFNARISEWSLDKLKREGFMMEDLIAGMAKYQPRHLGGGHVVELKHGGKKATTPLPFHKFASGTCVILSRTDPLIDPVLTNGRVRSSAEDKIPVLRGSVYTTSRGLIKVFFESSIEDLTKGQWRIDIGLDDRTVKKQIAAIRSMNLDPVRQDMIDMYAEVESKQRQEAIGTTKTTTKTGDPFTDVWNDPQNDAQWAQSRKLEVDQTILTGTHLRDLILRTFQQDYVPYASKSSDAEVAPSAAHLPHGPASHQGATHVKLEDVVAPPFELKASDVDALTVPSNRASRGPSGVLARNQLIQSWTKRYRSDGEVVKSDGDPQVPLNPSQMRAIAMMLSERLSLVQGPPGTGKTRVIIETIKLLKKHWKIPHPILVTAHTNVAVDNLLSGLNEHGVKAVRMGATERIRMDLHPLSFDEVVRDHPLFPEVERLDLELTEMKRANSEGSSGDRQLGKKKSSWSDNATRAKYHETLQRLHGRRTQMFQDVLKDTDVVCATCLSATSGYVLRHIDFPIVFLDEASMATEPLSLVPLMKGSSHVAIIGDHKQLPPVIVSEEAKAGGLATSLFERLIHEKHIPSIMLDTQYRMHPDIAAFPSKTFYNSALRDGTVTETGRVKPGFLPPVTSYLTDEEGQLRNVMFIDHEHPESPEMKSIANHGDAEIVTDIVVDLLHSNPDLSGSDIGIIAPYRAQIRVLDTYLNNDPIRSGTIVDVLGSDRARELADIEIKTVDGFEGREKQVILFSTVRCNDRGYVGFLADWRRLNVGVTRAKRGLIMVGSAKTLENARIGEQMEDSLPQGGTEVWRDFIAHLRRDGAIIQG